MALYPNGSDVSLWPTHHLSEAECLERELFPNPYTLTRGDQMGILLTQLAETQHQLAEARRVNTMLNDQLRAIREQRQEQAQPPPQQPRAKIIKR